MNPIDGEVVGDPGHLRHVALARGSLLAGVEVDRRHAAAVGREVADAILEMEVEPWVARGHREGSAARSASGAPDEVAREADDLGGLVHARPVAAEDLEGLARREPDADVLQDPEGRVLQPVELLVVEELHPVVRADRLQRRGDARDDFHRDGHACLLVLRGTLVRRIVP